MISIENIDLTLPRFLINHEKGVKWSPMPTYVDMFLSSDKKYMNWFYNNFKNYFTPLLPNEIKIGCKHGIKGVPIQELLSLEPDNTYYALSHLELSLLPKRYAKPLLEKFKVKLYKIASLENTDVKLIQTIAKTKKPIIISTGASDFNEIKRAIKIVNKFHNKVIILHCVSKYPTPLNDANLSRIIKLKKNFKKNMIGLSDHTPTIDTSLASIPLGVVTIEKHFKESDKNKSVDSTFSILPKDLNELKEKSIIYFNSTKPSNNKETNRADLTAARSKRSIFAQNDIKKNEKINEKNVISLRPKIGIGAENYFKILGKKAKKNIKKDDPIYFKDIF